MTTGDWVVLIIVVGALAIGLLSMLIGRLVALWDWFTVWWGEGVKRARITSSQRANENTSSSVVSRSTTRATDEGQRIATPDNAGNAVLIDNAVFETQVNSVLAIIETGKVGQTEAIEKIFRCSRSSKSDSIYQRARAAVVARQGPQFFQEDGTTGPATYPVSGRRSAS